MTITIFGLGFVGLTTALGFSEYGHTVYGLDVDSERLGLIQSGKLPFLEPGLDKALVRHLYKRFFPIDRKMMEEALAKSDCVYYCVGTPYGRSGQADLKYLSVAIEQTLGAIHDTRFRVLVVKSTIPPSTTQRKVIPFINRHKWHVGKNIGVANNPEFLREGHCWDDFIHADRIVLGVSDPHSEELLREVYASVSVPVFCVSLNTGEYIKYLSNTLLATLISYSNEMSIIADKIGGIDVAQAFRILHMDKRWANAPMASYVYPGCGYGGYCLPKDTNALYAVSKNAGYDAKMLKNVIAINEQMPAVIERRIARVLKDDKHLCIGVLGLSFKPGSDDVRDTPSAKIINRLIADGYKNILAYDPVAMTEFHKHYDLPVAYASGYDDVVNRADAFVIITAWPEFADIRTRTTKPVVDCRYML